MEPVSYTHLDVYKRQQKAALPDTMQSGASTLVSSEEQVLEFAKS